MLSAKVMKGGAGAWGAIPMPAQDVTAAESKALVEWMLSGGK
jgi:cytochrome c